MEFLLLLLKKGREAILTELIHHYTELDMEDKGVLLAKLFTQNRFQKTLKRISKIK